MDRIYLSFSLEVSSQCLSFVSSFLSFRPFWDPTVSTYRYPSELMEVLNLTCVSLVAISLATSPTKPSFLGLRMYLVKEAITISRLFSGLCLRSTIRVAQYICRVLGEGVRGFLSSSSTRPISQSSRGRRPRVHSSDDDEHSDSSSLGSGCETFRRITNIYIYIYSIWGSFDIRYTSARSGSSNLAGVGFHQGSARLRSPSARLVGFAEAAVAVAPLTSCLMEAATLVSDVRKIGVAVGQKKFA